MSINNEDKLKSTKSNNIKTIGDSLKLNIRPDIKNIGDMAESMSKKIRPEIWQLKGINKSINMAVKADIWNLRSIKESMSTAMRVDIQNLSRIAESMSFTTRADIWDLRSVVGWTSNKSKHDFNNLAKTIELIIKKPKFHTDKLAKALELVNQINLIEDNNFELLEEESNITKEIDWKDYELNDEVINQTIHELENKKSSKMLNKLSVGVKKFLIFIYYLVHFIAVLGQAMDVFEDRAIPIVQSFKAYEHEGIFQSEKTGLDWLNNELKKDVSDQVISNFRIVTKEDLIVREGKQKDSRITGKLERGYVVQILEKRKNWCYVSYSDYKNEEVIEGWTNTRHLREIK